MRKTLFQKYKRNFKRRAEAMLATTMVMSQLLFTFSSVITAPAVAAGTVDMNLSVISGQLTADSSYTNGNTTTYSELESINFRFSADASADSDATIEIRYAAEDSKCLFFDGSFSLGTHDGSASSVVATSGVAPVVQTVGSPSIDGNDWVQEISISFAAAGSAEVYFYLTLSNEAGDCTGSSTHVNFGASSGDIGTVGSKAVPIPAGSVIELASITVTKNVDTDGDGESDRTATANEWFFALDDGTLMPTDANGQVVFSGLDTGVYNITEMGPDGYEFHSISGDCTAGDVLGTADASVTAATTAVDAECVFLNTTESEPLPTTLILEKVLPNDDGGTATPADFPVFIDGVPAVWGENLVEPGTFTVSETSKAGYLAGDWVCDSATSATITLTEGETKTCSITNDDIAPVLRIVKYATNDNGGAVTAENFEILLNDTALTQTPVTTSNDPLTTASYYDIPVVAGTPYTVSETPVNGYTQTLNSCFNINDFNNPVALSTDGTFTPGLGDSIMCDISNNDDGATLTVYKRVHNDDGSTLGAGAFTLHIDRTNGGGYFTGKTVEDGGEVFNLDGGEEFFITEVLDDYSAMYTTDFSDDCSGTIANGDDLVCYVDNYDKPGTITVTKELKEDSGGVLGDIIDSFILLVNDTVVSSGVAKDFPAGSYTVSEIEHNIGYEQTSIICLDSSGDDLGSSFDLINGQSVSCVITNDDIPTRVTITKKLIKDDGGRARVRDFALYLNGNRVQSGVAQYVPGNTTYTVSERTLPGYEHVSTSCYDHTADQILGSTFIAKLGHDVRCTIVNDDIAPTLTINKLVINDNGGDADGDDFSFVLKDRFYRDVANLDNGEEFEGRARTTYRIAENKADGYEFVRITGDEACPRDLYSRFTLPLGEDVVCTVVNDDIPPVVIVKKQTDPSYHEQDFNFTLTNTYFGGQLPDLDRLAFGPSEDVYPFTLDTELFDFTHLSFKVFFGPHSENELHAGGIAITEEEADGWVLDNISCYQGIHTHHRQPFTSTDESDTIEFKVGIGDVVTCIFENSGVADINVIKFHDLNENGIKEDGEPTLPDWDISLTELKKRQNPDTQWELTNEEGVAQFEGLSVNNPYIVDEQPQPGWRQTGAYCGERVVIDEVFTHALRFPGPVQDNPGTMVRVQPGDEVTCYIGNAQDPYLTLAKTNDTGGAVKEIGDTVAFTLTVTNPNDSGMVYGAVVTDVLQDGLEYTGIWSANSSVRGNIAGLPTLDPAYASPGSWMIGDLVPGEVVSLVYTAVIGEIVDGDYPDVAFVEGWSDGEFLLYGNCGRYNMYCLPQEQVLNDSLARVSLFPVIATATPFVGTVVKVASAPDTPDTGFVLGERLVNTGYWAILPTMIGSIIIAGTLLLNRKHKRSLTLKKFINFEKLRTGFLSSIVTMLALGVLFAPATLADDPCNAGLWQLEVSEPSATVVNEDFNLDYQLSSTSSSASYIVDLVVDTVVVETNVVADSSASGSFIVSLVDESLHEVKVVVNNCGQEKQVTYNIEFDETAPGTLVYQGVTRVGNTYTIRFTSPADSDVATIQLFATTNTDNFPLDETTLLEEIPTSPGEEHEYVYVAPSDEDYYFAAVVFDSAGNPSEAVGDEQIINVVVPLTAPALDEEDGDVLGETDVEDEDADDEDDNLLVDTIKNPVSWAVFVAVVGVLYLLWSKKSKKTE